MSARERPAAGSGLPLIAGAIRGVRRWDLVYDEESGCERLGAGFNKCLWPLDGPLAARCLDGERCDEPGHAPPVPDCSCGIYAHHPGAEYVSLVDGESLTEVHGVIEAWGKVEVHAEGFRAEYARPLALLVAAGASRRYRKRVLGAAACHEIEAVALEGEDDLERYLRENVRGLDPEFVEGLLDLAQPVAARPRATAFVTKRAKAIAGFGYMPEGGPDEPEMWTPETEIGVHGARLLRVAGTSYRPEALQHRVFEPGRPLRLVPEPTNLQDRDAIGIWDESLRLRVGFVPRELAPEIGRRLRAGRIGAVRSFWQWRELGSGRRIGLHVLVSTSPDVRLHAQPRGRRRHRRLAAGRRAPLEAATLADEEIPF